MGLTKHKLIAVATVACAMLAQASAPGGQRERIPWLWDNAAVPRWSGQHVAVLAAHVHLTGSELRRRARQDSPRLAAGTQVTPVVHVELSVVRPPVLDAAARDAILHDVLRAARGSTSGWVQLDMEARPSHRTFYLELVRELRHQLPPDIKLSVTALAWWCRSHEWLDNIAADEVVPMVFRMGRETDAIRATWEQQPGKLHPRCRAGAIGTATSEPLAGDVMARYSREYVFDRRSWRTEIEKREEFR
jgi:hypothetical protein